MASTTTTPSPLSKSKLADVDTLATHDDVKETENIDMEDGNSKLSFVWGLLRKLANVKDIASVRMSLPANLMEPMSNLEFWNYNDRPDLFATMGDPEDPVERMLRVVRWFLSKDTKWKDNKLRKPYNPILGEVFQCHWLVDRNPVATFLDDTASSRPSTSTPIVSASAPALQNLRNSSVETDTASVVSHRSERTLVDPAARPGSYFSTAPGTLRVNCLTEQILHHPPVSAFYYKCEEKGVVARGVDHVSAKFTGTSIKVGAGDHNAGIYVMLEQRDGEEYNMTYPWASINGWLSGRPYITVSETTVVTCPKTKLKCVLLYKDEPYFTAPRFAVEGKIFRYDPAADALKSEKERRESEKLNKIPDSAVVATIWGAWNGKIYAKMGPHSLSKQSVSTEKQLLLDISTSVAADKMVRPLDEQEPNESRRLWADVTAAIETKDFNAATRLKRAIEDEQRKIAGDREKGTVPPFQNRYFDFKVPPGTPASHVSPEMMFERGKPYLKEGVNMAS
ncbi:hypothetical protein HDU67_005550 [Dinochytrium kinnereticum]|nr:hypothetical protein HDU67_005550 [Dinochytrium kinnereticum]